MKCIKETLIQKYIDGECSKNEEDFIETHFLNCSECQFKYDERVKLSMNMKQVLCTLNSEVVEIPKFSIPTKQLGKTRKLFIISLSVASILLLAVFLTINKSKSTQDELIVIQNIPLEIDANLPASEQEFVIDIFDGQGRRSECITD